MNKRYLSSDHVRIDLLINKFIVEFYRGRIETGICIDNSFRSRPVNSAEAHRTWFTTAIYRTVRELKRM